MPNKTILVVASLGRSLIHFRGDMIKQFIKDGHKVFAAAPEIPPHIIEELKKIGATPVEFKLQRTGLNPITDFRTILELKEIIRKYNIEIVLPYTIKPVIYSSFAAKQIRGVKVISLITGLGFTFSDSSSKARLLGKVTEFLYKQALKHNEVVIFQNKDDLSLFYDRNLLSKNIQTKVVNGSGVNLSKYPFRTNNKKTENLHFAIVARLIQEKGIHLFLEAAKQMKKEFPESEFHVIGAAGNSPSAIDIQILEELHQQKIITFHGSVNNVSELLAGIDVFVLPTYYREGIPRSILEALSIGMPIITTDTPGCRETIYNNENGILIPPRDQKALNEAMRYLLMNPTKVSSMGLESRRLAEEKFDVNKINHEISLIVESIN